MTTLADRTIAALRTHHDHLASVVPALPAAQLSGPSGAADWTVAQVLSHLGSGAEIALSNLDAALTGAEPGGQDFFSGVWARWDALAPQDQASGFLRRNAELVGALESLTPDQRTTTQVDVGFLPAPLPFATFAGMRLAESALHGWDVNVALGSAAALDTDTAYVLAEHYVGGLSFMLGFIGKRDVLAEPTVVRFQDTPYSLVLDEGIAITTTAAEPTATFSGPLEAAIRLIAGRLTEAHTPSGTRMTGNVSLHDLRRAFPGY
ncbi:maleylpyruvate isomerase N-terminal domain-containing protein [Streptomyces mirabilis]